MPNVMAAQPNIGGALCESSVIPFLVPRRKLCLTPLLECRAVTAANIAEGKTWTKVNFARGEIPSGGKSRRKSQETAKCCAN